MITINNEDDQMPSSQKFSCVFIRIAVITALHVWLMYFVAAWLRSDNTSLTATEAWASGIWLNIGSFFPTCAQILTCFRNRLLSPPMISLLLVDGLIFWMGVIKPMTSLDAQRGLEILSAPLLTMAISIVLVSICLLVFRRSIEEPMS
jgi:hypothetical protein